MPTPTLVQATHNQINTLSATGLNVVLPAAAAAGDALIAVVIGQRSTNPLGQRTDTNPYFSTAGNVPAPVLNDDQGNTWTTVKAFQMVDLLTTAPTYPSTAESVPDLDAQYPSVYLAAAFGSGSPPTGAQSLNVRATYLDPNAPWSSTVAYLIGDAVYVSGTTYVCTVAHTNHTPPNGTYWAAVTPSTDARFAGGPGKDIYTGVDVVLLEFSNCIAVDGSGIAGTSEANPAELYSGSPATPTTIGTAGDLIIAVGLQKDSNEFSESAGWTAAYRGKLIGSEEHFIVAYKVATGATAPSFVNPVGRIASGYDPGPTTSAGYETVIVAAAFTS